MLAEEMCPEMAKKPAWKKAKLTTPYGEFSSISTLLPLNFWRRLFPFQSRTFGFGKEQDASKIFIDCELAAVLPGSHVQSSGTP